jgi:5-methyltetrahydrofolate--homocysteine methyltransferase
VGFAGADEPAVMAEVVGAVMEEVEVPLCIDSANLQATEAGLKTFAERGGKKALVNSTTGEDERMGKFLPLAAEYGAAIIGLAHDERGIDFEIDHRLEAAAKIFDRAAQYGIPRSDIIIDALTLAVGANTNAGRVTLDAQIRVSTELKANTTSGASNVSFGLPDRKLINLAYLPLLISRGLTSAITNPLEDSIRNVVLACDLLMGHDADARRWIGAYRKRRAAEGGSG